jgi:hypothetical protein
LKHKEWDKDNQLFSALLRASVHLFLDLLENPDKEKLLSTNELTKIEQIEKAHATRDS